MLGLRKTARKTAKLAVDGGDKGGQAVAAFAEIAGQVGGGKAAVLLHGLGRVVHGGERVHVIRVPAAVFILALDADRVRRAVENAGYILVIIRLFHIFA